MKKYSQPFLGGGPINKAFAKASFVISFLIGSNSNFVFNRCAITPRQNTWLKGPEIENGDRAFSAPLHAFKNLA